METKVKVTILKGGMTVPIEIYPHKYSKMYFFSWYFQNMLELLAEPTFYTCMKEKAKDILKIVNVYRKRYGANKNKPVSIVWKRMKGFYWDNWMEIHYWSDKI